MAYSNSRRKFIRDFSATTAAVSSGFALAACGGGSGATPHLSVQFTHGVASGDPLADRVILWTRVTPSSSQDLEVRWEVAEDSNFRNLAKAGSVTTGAARDYTVKVDAAGLLPHKVYYYRFRCNDTLSPVGKTKTLAIGPLESVKLAVFSCSNYPAGYFNVYAEAAKLNDIDAALHLGDYIYEYGKEGFGTQDAAALGRASDPPNETVTLTDYRRRYAQYRSDPDLQALHANVPFIVVWDDHEFSDNAWSAGALNHDPAIEGLFTARRMMAVQAYHEWMPIRPPDETRLDRIYRSFDFGSLFSLHMLDTRLIGREQQLNYANYLGAGGALNTTAFLADVTNPSRQLMGSEQTAWLNAQMTKSNATWQILGQQILMAHADLPAPLVLQTMGFGAYLALVAKAEIAPITLTAAEKEILDQPAIPYNLDAWDGYQAARETVFESAKSLDKNLIVLSGDTHNSWAGDLVDSAGRAVGVEFGGPSVSSPGFEEVFPEENPDLVAAALQRFMKGLQYAEAKSRGFIVLTVMPSETRAEYRFVSTV
ncbi:MAG: alkaline phosphatase, partial [Burkholderiales bacterium]